MSNSSIPTASGTYVVVLKCNHSKTARIGQLGSLHLKPGYYYYVGSAFGPGGLNSRVGRHLRSDNKKARWHIDYLRSVTEADDAWVYASDERVEHDWARQLGSLPGITTPMHGFGSSDCSCTSHLLYSPTAVTRPDFTQQTAGQT